MIFILKKAIMTKVEVVKEVEMIEEPKLCIKRKILIKRRAVANSRIKMAVFKEREALNCQLNLDNTFKRKITNHLNTNQKKK